MNERLMHNFVATHSGGVFDSFWVNGTVDHVLFDCNEFRIVGRCGNKEETLLKTTQTCTILTNGAGVGNRFALLTLMLRDRKFSLPPSSIPPSPRHPSITACIIPAPLFPSGPFPTPRRSSVSTAALAPLPQSDKQFNSSFSARHA